MKSINTKIKVNLLVDQLVFSYKNTEVKNIVYKINNLFLSTFTLKIYKLKYNPKYIS